MKESSVDKELPDAILLDLSQGDYERAASPFVDGFSLSQFWVSRCVQQRPQTALEEFLDLPTHVLFLAENCILKGSPSYGAKRKPRSNRRLQAFKRGGAGCPREDSNLHVLADT